ncbi:unnamed protein product [marine sediment metagenome]|uniref:Uncharacterized protein n=1 Tax=marine sediment metagenome TaxID=412755 RepID=X1QE28_9ZZZZ
MATTRLSPSATPGRNYNFTAKGVPATGPHTGDFTRLSTTATPGKRYSFTAKTSVGAHSGTFTRLSITATPGRRYSFNAKDAVEVVVEIGPRPDLADQGSADAAVVRLTLPLTEWFELEEEELIEIVQMLMMTGLIE